VRETTFIVLAVAVMLLVMLSVLAPPTLAGAQDSNDDKSESPARTG
jgi:uncharacterized membrane protein